MYTEIRFLGVFKREQGAIHFIHVWPFWNYGEALMAGHNCTTVST